MGTPSDAGRPMVEVRLVGMPLPLWQRARERHADLLREFALIEQGGGPEEADLPGQRLRELTLSLQGRYGAYAAKLQEEATAAAAAGQQTADLALTVPADVAESVTELRDLLDEVDEWCRQGALLTLAAPPDIVRFRSWYLEEFVRQSRGAPPRSWQQATSART